MLSAIVLFNYFKNRVSPIIKYAISKQKNIVIFNKSENIPKFQNAACFNTNAAPKPIKIWADGKCFNVGPSNKHTKSSNKKGAIFPNDHCDINDVAFITKDNGLITASLKLPSYYYKKLRFDMMNDVKIIMNETNTHISIPRVGDNDKLKILGDNKQQIRNSLQDILVLIGSIRNASRPLQFLSVPLCNDEIKNNFIKFKEKVLQEKNIKGVDETLFISPLKLHLTINVMVLLDDSEKQEAVRVLQDYHKNILKPLLDKTGPLKIEVSGIECMNNNYEKTHVLYAKAKISEENNSANLQNILNQLSDYFYNRGLLKQHQEYVRVHMTLMNTKYREDEKNSKLPKNRHRFAKRVPFDATRIMEKYKCFEFGICNFNKIHISIMSLVDKSGFYQPLTVINL